jgi:hypothetical protein
MGTHRGRKLDLQHPRAALTFDDVVKAFCIHGQQVYPVASAPASIFKAAVLTLVPHWKDSSTYGEALASKEIDVVTRWWLLCALADAGQAMKLYGSREEAEQAMSDQGLLDQSATIAR